ncbi:WD repeat-containing protein 75 [Physocladia obscura]|uniref:WD repeat-containing protein 75 n=1 Tax=Physocladia obscura TaxID=109957 RepID=A0AAD5T1L6_9FUNG|nr:WD repeat-containing protein 75 [Physocladia obscura]
MTTRRIVLAGGGGGWAAVRPVFAGHKGEFVVSGAGSAVAVASTATAARLRVLRVNIDNNDTSKNKPSESKNNGGSDNENNTFTNRAAEDFAPVVALAPHASAPLLIYAAYSDGCVRLWDVSDASLLKVWRFNVPITAMVQDPAHTDTFYVAFKAVKNKNIRHTSSSSSSSEHEKANRIAQLVLPLLGENHTVDSNKPPTPRAILLASDSSFVGLAVSNNVVAVCTEKSIWVWPNSSDDHSETTKVATKIKLPNRAYNKPPKITHLAAHPSTPMIAVGITSGEIFLYHNPFQQSQVKATQKIHWHAQSVLAFEFSNDGTTLVSGGLESVLVLWQLDTQKRKPIPRVAGGAALQSIACSSDDTAIAVVCADSCIRIVSVPKLEVSGVMSGLKARKGRELEKNSLVIDPRSGAVVLAGSPGCLQFYDAYNDVHMMEIEAISQNRVVSGGYVSKDGVERVVGEESLARVKLVAFEKAPGRRSQWMATVDERSDMVVADEEEVWIKFWMWDDVKQIYTVNTRVASPHDKKITSIHFLTIPNESEPTEKTLLLVSTSLDTRFKVWALTPTSLTSRDTTPFWTQRSQGSYRNTPIHHAATSLDASILAVACGSVVTLWNPVTNAMCATLVHPCVDEHILMVEFAGIPQNIQNNSSNSEDIPSLIAVTANRCHVWNLLTGTIWWTLELGGETIGLASDPDTGRFAVSVLGSFSSENRNYRLETKILELHVSSPIPKMTHLAKGQVLGIQYMPKSHIPIGARTANRLLILSASHEIEALESASVLTAQPSEASKSADIIASAGIVPPKTAQPESVGSGLFSGIYGSAAFAGPDHPYSANSINSNQKSLSSSKRDKREIVSASAKLRTIAKTFREEQNALSFFDNTASHLLPPPIKLSHTFFDAILKKRDIAAENVERAGEWITGDSAGQAGEREENLMVVDDVVGSVGERDLDGLEFLGDVFKGLLPVQQKQQPAADNDDSNYKIVNGGHEEVTQVNGKSSHGLSNGLSTKSKRQNRRKKFRGKCLCETTATRRKIAKSVSKKGRKTMEKGKAHQDRRGQLQQRDLRQRDFYLKQAIFKTRRRAQKILASFNRRKMVRFFVFPPPKDNKHNNTEHLNAKQDGDISITTFSTLKINENSELESNSTNPDHNLPEACLFIASLSTSISDKTLQESLVHHFSQWGQITNIKVLKDWLARPYAFVQYENPQDATTALSRAHNTLLCGRYMRVEQAKVNRTLFVAKFGSHTTVVELTDILEKAFGPVEEIKILHNFETGKSKGCGFVKFQLREDAIKAFLGIRQKYQWTIEWATNMDRNKGEIDLHSLFIGQLNHNLITDELLREKFGKYGKIATLQLVNKMTDGSDARPAFAFITFAEESSAEQAIEHENAKLWLDRNIRVQYREVGEYKGLFRRSRQFSGSGNHVFENIKRTHQQKDTSNSNGSGPSRHQNQSDATNTLPNSDKSISSTLSTPVKSMKHSIPGSQPSPAHTLPLPHAYGLPNTQTSHPGPKPHKQSQLQSNVNIPPVHHCPNIQHAPQFPTFQTQNRPYPYPLPLQMFPSLSGNPYQHPQMMPIYFPPLNPAFEQYGKIAAATNFQHYQQNVAMQQQSSPFVHYPGNTSAPSVSEPISDRTATTEQSEENYEANSTDAQELACIRNVTLAKVDVARGFKRYTTRKIVERVVYAASGIDAVKNDKDEDIGDELEVMSAIL